MITEETKTIMNNLYEITWVDGEPACRADDVLTDSNWCETTFGTNQEFEFGDNYILSDYILYLDDINIYSLLEIFGTYYPVEEYDLIASSGRGQTKHDAIQSILGRDDAFVVQSPSFLRDVEIKPLKDFALDFPKFNREEYDRFYRSLNNHYDELKKR